MGIDLNRELTEIAGPLEMKGEQMSAAELAEPEVEAEPIEQEPRSPERRRSFLRQLFSGGRRIERASASSGALIARQEALEGPERVETEAAVAEEPEIVLVSKEPKPPLALMPEVALAGRRSVPDFVRELGGTVVRLYEDPTVEQIALTPDRIELFREGSTEIVEKTGLPANFSPWAVRDLACSMPLGGSSWFGWTAGLEVVDGFDGCLGRQITLYPVGDPASLESICAGVPCEVYEMVRDHFRRGGQGLLCGSSWQAAQLALAAVLELLPDQRIDVIGPGALPPLKRLGVSWRPITDEESYQQTRLASKMLGGIHAIIHRGPAAQWEAGPGIWATALAVKMIASAGELRLVLEGFTRPRLRELRVGTSGHEETVWQR